MLLRVLGGCASALGLLATAAAAQTDDVLAPGRAGQLQCFEPNVAAKTCQSLGGYTINADGVIDNAARVLIMPSPVVVMEVTAPIVVRDNAICGPLTQADIDRTTFTIDGRAATAEETQQIRASMTEQLGPMLNLESCMTLTPDGETLRADTTIAGRPQPQLTQRVLWVGANDGWRVAP